MLKEQKTVRSVIGKVDMMKWNHHYDAKISNTIDFINHLSPSMVIQTTGGDINVCFNERLSPKEKYSSDSCIK